MRGWRTRSASGRLALEAGEVNKRWVLLFSQFLLFLLVFDFPSLILELERIAHI